MLQRIHEGLLGAARRLAWLPPLLARLSVGLVFASAGWGKLREPERVVEFFRSLGIPAPEWQAPFVAATELVCGLLLCVGLGTRFAAVPLVVTMIVAIRTALWSEVGGVVDLAGTQEWLLIALLVWLAIAGGGAVSLDTLAARRSRAHEPLARGAAASAGAPRTPVRP